MEKIDWLDITDSIGQINCAYFALISLLTWTTKELTDDERSGIAMINNYIFDLLKSTLGSIDELRKAHKGTG